MDHPSRPADLSLHATLFGRFRLARADGTEIVIGGKRAEALMAILCLAQGEAIEREQLSQMLWRGKFRAQARASLRQTLLELKKLLADHCPDPFESTRERVRLRAGTANCDLAELESALSSGSDDRSGQLLETIGSHALLEGMEFGSAFAEWVSARRRQTELRLQQAIEQTLANPAAHGPDQVRNRLREAWQQRGRIPAASGVDVRLAVLPFRFAATDEALAVFGQGLFDELVTTLARVPQLRVAGRGSSMQQKGSDLTTVQVARALHVTHLLEGSLQRQGLMLRAHVSLIDGRNGFSIWSRSYDGSTTELFALQQEIAEAVTHELGSTLQRQLSRPAQRRSTADKDAYALYLQGRALTTRAIGDGVLSKAVELLEAALAIDPDFAAGWTALAEAHVYTAVYTPCLDRLEKSARMAECATRAIELDPAQGHARAMLGIHCWTLNDPVGALDLAHEAYRLEPHNPDVSLRLGSFLLYIGRTREALPYIEAAVDQDPINGRNYAMLSVARLNLGEIDGAIAAGQRMVDLGLPSMWLAVATAASGDRSRAVDQYRQTMQLMNKTMFPPAGTRPLTGAALAAFWEIASRGVCSGRAVHRKLYCTMLDYLHSTLPDPCDTSIVLPAVWMGYAGMVFKTLGTQITPANMFCLMSLWADLDPIRRIRLDPGFLPFAERIGLTAAWDKYGRPDLLPA